MPLCPTRIPFSGRKLSASVLLKICSGSVSCSSASTDSQELGTAECHTAPWASWGILAVITLGHKPSELWWYPELPLKEQNSGPCSLIQLPSLVGSYKGLQTKVIKNNEMELQLRVHLTLKYPLYFLFLNCKWGNICLANLHSSVVCGALGSLFNVHHEHHYSPSQGYAERKLRLS